VDLRKPGLSGEDKAFIFNILLLATGLHISVQMFRIRRSEDHGTAVFACSGRIEEKDVAEIRKVVEAEAGVAGIALDLEEVKLVDREAVRFLTGCKARGIKLMNCPPYIREWIETGSDTSHES
jgi:hypothetical protein